MKIQPRQFKVAKGGSHWTELVGRFTDRLNTIADGFLMNNKTHYPSGQKIQKFTYPHVAKDLANYCKAMGAKTSDQRCACLEELYQLCDKSELGFTKKYWICTPKKTVMKSPDPRLRG